MLNTNKRITKQDRRAIVQARREVRTSPEPVASERQLKTLSFNVKTGRY